MIFWNPKETIGFPVLSSGEQGMYRAYHSAGSISCFSLFPSLQLWFLWKFMAGYLFRDVLRSCLSRSHRLAVLLFCLFSQPGGIPFCGFESRPLPFPFSYFSILVPRDASHLRHKRSLVISSFLAGLFGACGFYSVSYFSFCPFLSNCLNLPLTLLIRLGGSAPLDGRWGSWLFLL